MLRLCDVVVGSVGTTIVEAAYYRKPVIQFSDLGVTQLLPNVVQHSDFSSLAGRIREVVSSAWNLEDYEFKLHCFVASAMDVGFEIDHDGLGCMVTRLIWMGFINISNGKYYVVSRRQKDEEPLWAVDMDSYRFHRNRYRQHLARYQPIARESARIILPLVGRFLGIQSLLDIGCGTGTWLSMAKEHGIKRLFGVDGPWLDPKNFEVDGAGYKTADLTEVLDLGQRFDLVCCMEVASDIPAQFEDVLMDTLLRHSDAILFSSAVMTQHHETHVNKRSQSYWANKFTEQGVLKTFDIIRPSRVVLRTTVGAHYRQNCILFALWRCGNVSVQRAVRDYEMT